MFKISRLRQVLLVRKASTTFAYARFTPLLSVFDCEIRETAIRLHNAEFLASRSITNFCEARIYDRWIEESGRSPDMGRLKLFSNKSEFTRYFIFIIIIIIIIFLITA